MNIRKIITDAFWCSTVVGIFGAGWLIIDATQYNSGHSLMTMVLMGLCCNIAGVWLALEKGVVCQLFDHKYQDCPGLPRYGSFRVLECRRCQHIKIGAHHGKISKIVYRPRRKGS